MPTIRIATRTSALAMWQAEEVQRQLLAAHHDIETTIVPIDSDGDIASTQGFETFGYKGIFTKRIEAALLDGRADIAVHSMKDVHSALPDVLTIAAVLKREDPRDAFISAAHPTLEAMPEGAVVGSASVRRQAIIKHLRPDLTVVPFRGNVPTRLEKLERGEVDATLLAVAGLKRLGLQSHIRQILPPEVMLPAIAQGAVGIECRKEDGDIMARLNAISHHDTMIAITAERAMLAVLDGDCKTPLCGFARIDENRLTLQGRWVEPDGSRFHSVELSGNIEEAMQLGEEAGAKLKRHMGAA